MKLTSFFIAKKDILSGKIMYRYVYYFGFSHSGFPQDKKAVISNIIMSFLILFL